MVTDRRLLDDQIQTTIKQFMQVGATVGHAERSGDLRNFIEQGKKIIVSTVQKFPFILDEIAAQAGKTFAIVIDEAHSSQGGKTSAAMSQALAQNHPAPPTSARTACPSPPPVAAYRPQLWDRSPPCATMRPQCAGPDIAGPQTPTPRTS